jgi:hypothetical protein
MMGEKWVELTKNRKLYRKVASRLAFEAVLAHPLEYAQLVLRKIARAAYGMSQGKVAPAAFWAAQESANADRINRPRNQLELVYGMKTDAYLRLVEERHQRTTWLAPAMEELSRVLNWTDYRGGAPGEDPEINLTVLGWLLALGLIACLSPRYFICRALLWLPVAFYLFAIFGVGDAVRRYLQPVDWVGIVLIALGLDTIATLITDGITRLERRIRGMDVGSTSANVPMQEATSNRFVRSE